MDDVKRLAAVLPSDPRCRPIHYALTGERVTLSSDVPFALQASSGEGKASPSWTIPRRTSGESNRVPNAAFVTLPSPGEPVSVVDLIAAKCTSIIGTSEQQTELVESIRYGLSRSDSDTLMIGVGDFGPQLARRCATVREACSLVTSSLGAIVVFVGEEEATSDDFERLIAAIRRHAAAGVVAGGAQAEARLVLVSHGERCAVYLRPPRSSTAAVPQVTRRQAAGVEVAILGPVEVRGSAEPLGGHPLLTELVVYLAMHPEGVSTTAWETALWPERRMPQQTIANRLSEARRALGIASDGVPRLRRSDDRYLVAEVTTDYDRFKVLADDEDDPTAWLRALEIVRGRPFTDLHQGHWVALEGFALEVAHQVVDCALRFGRTSLRNQDPDAAMRAAQLALRAVPWDERLHRLLMVASDAAGDRAGVEATIRHLALVLEVDGDPLRAVHPETARLYARLSGRMDAPLGA